MAGHDKPGRLSSAINHLETHQLEGQYFVGSRVIYNLLKVGSNCNSQNNKQVLKYAQCISGQVNNTAKQYLDYWLIDIDFDWFRLLCDLKFDATHFF